MKALKLAQGTLQTKGRHLITYPDAATLDGAIVIMGCHSIEVPAGSSFVDAGPAIAAGFPPRPIVAMVPQEDGGSVTARTREEVSQDAALAEIISTPDDSQTTIPEWEALAEAAGLEWPDLRYKSDNVEALKEAAGAAQ